MTTPLFVKLDGAADLCSVSEDTILRGIRAGTLRAKRSGQNGGGHYLIRVSELEAWFDALVDA